VLGKSTVQKLHQIENATLHHSQPAGIRRSNAPAVLARVATVLVILTVGIAAFVVSQKENKRAKREAAAPPRPRRTRPEPVGGKQEATTPTAGGKEEVRQGKADFQRQFDDVAKYEQEHPDNFIVTHSRWEKLRQDAKGTEYEAKAAQALVRLEARRQAVIARIAAKSEERTVPVDAGNAPALAGEAASAAPAGGEAESRLDDIANALLKMDFETARRLLDEGDETVDGRAIKTLGLQVAAMPQVIADSFKKDVNKEITVRLKKGTQKLTIKGVQGTKVAAVEVRKLSSGDVGTIDRSFDVRDLSVQDQFGRLGKETTPERCVMRGLLAYAGKAQDRAKEHFVQSRAELGTLLSKRVDAIANARENAIAERRKTLAEAEAAKALRGVLSMAGIQMQDRECAELVLEVKKKRLDQEQIERVQSALAIFTNRFADTSVAATHAYLINVLPQLIPGIALHYDQETLPRVVEELRKDNPNEARIQDHVLEVKDNALVLNVAHMTGVSNIAAVAGLPLNRAFLTATRVRDISPLKHMPLVELRLRGLPIKDLSPLKGMPLRVLEYGGWGWTQTGYIESIAPLSGMKLTHLHLWFQPRVKDLRPLKGMPLEELSIVMFGVEDLTPLKGMPLGYLNIAYCGRIRDLGPLRECPLKYLKMGWTSISDLSALKDKEGLKITQECK